MTKLTVGSAFSGIGGIDLAFALADYEIKWQIEIDPFCQKVLEKHHDEFFPSATIFSDITTVTAGEPGYVDVIVGGFPCQDISVAGKGKGIQHGNRSGLWFELERLIRNIRPRAIMLENVARIVSSRKEEDGTLRPADMAVVVNALSEMGYDARWSIISAADTGAPHQRDRWFCVAFSNGNRIRRDKRGNHRQKRHLLRNKYRNAPQGQSERGRRLSRTRALRSHGKSSIPYTPRKRTPATKQSEQGHGTQQTRQNVSNTRRNRFNRQRNASRRQNLSHRLRQLGNTQHK